MLFHEIYGVYYEIMADIIAMAQRGELDQGSLLAAVRRKGFEESVISIPAALRDGSWPLIGPDYRTPVREPPERPVTELEKRWLKAILLDPRVQLFDLPEDDRLKDIEPLFTPDVFVYYDRSSDGDPYSSAHYREMFRRVLRAVREGLIIRIGFRSQKGEIIRWRGAPKALEYSSGDDKFRLRMQIDKRERTLNLARVVDCEVTDERSGADPEVHFRTGRLVLEVTDERNALERVLMHFSHFEKTAERIGEKTYRVTMVYQEEDLKELVIRILSFGPTVRVISPEKIKERLVQRIERQLGMTDR